MSNPSTLEAFPLHLALDGTVVPLERFTGELSWYAGYERRHAADGPAGRLVSWHRFDASWDVWEMHPGGDEVVLCVAGTIDLVQELLDGPSTTTLDVGQWARNPAGVWHTANVTPGSTAACVFITSGWGTEHRPR